MIEHTGTRSVVTSPRTDTGRDGVAFATVLAGAQDGAPWAFRRIFADLGPAILGYARGAGAEDPDGLANEVFLRAFRDVVAFDGTAAQFRSWMFSIAHNLVIDDRRRRARRPTVVELTDATTSVSGGDVENDALARLGAAELRPLLDALTDDQRAVLLLRVVADLPADDVARITGRSGAAVRALHHRALGSIRRELANDPRRDPSHRLPR